MKFGNSLLILHRWRGQVCHSDTISALGFRLIANCNVLISNAARLTMLLMHIHVRLRRDLSSGIRIVVLASEW